MLLPLFAIRLVTITLYTIWVVVLPFPYHAGVAWWRNCKRVWNDPSKWNE